MEPISDNSEQLPLLVAVASDRSDAALNPPKTSAVQSDAEQVGSDADRSSDRRRRRRHHGHGRRKKRERLLKNLLIAGIYVVGIITAMLVWRYLVS